MIRTRFGVAVSVLMIMIIGALLVAGLRLHGGNAARSSGLACAVRNHDFGLVPPALATALSHEFVLQNDGEATFRIIEARASCGCTTPQLPVQSVPPGTTVGVRVDVNWGSRHGPQEATVLLTTDPPSERPLILTVRGSILADVAVTPAAINFGNVAPGSVLTRTATVVAGAGDKPFRITGVQNPSRYLEIVRKDAPDAESRPVQATRAEFLVTLRSPRTGGKERVPITFQTDFPGAKRVTLWVDAHFEPCIVAEPASVVFSSIAEASEPAAHDVFFMSNDPDLEIADSHVQIVPNTPGDDSPFKLLDTGSIVEHNGRRAKRVTIMFLGNHRRPGVTRASLALDCRSDQIHVPLIGVTARPSQATLE